MPVDGRQLTRNSGARLGRLRFFPYMRRACTEVLIQDLDFPTLSFPPTPLL